MNTNNHVGVIVARFQVPELHLGHRALLDHVVERHESVIVFLGCCEARLTKRDPLDFETRRVMVQAAYPNVRILPVYDNPSNEVWSNVLDALIEGEHPDTPATLYGSHGSFITAYSGKHETNRIPFAKSKSGTEVRDTLVPHLHTSPDFRAGMIHASKHRFNTAFQVVDVAIIKAETGEVLLGRKEEDGEGLRFLGGFVDTTDESLERAAKREVIEEASHIEVGNIRYTGSTWVDDWRYRGREDSIMTAFFMGQYLWGAARPSDDIDELEWVHHSEVPARLIEAHQPLGELLRDNLNDYLKTA